jgi:integrase/recombinase XerD
MEMDMKMRRFSPKTTSCYRDCMRNIAAHFGKSLGVLGDEEIRSYLHHLREDRQASLPVVRQSYRALKFFFENTLQQPLNGSMVPRSKQRKKLPGVLSRVEVKSIFSAMNHLWHRAMLMMIYSAGLRTYTRRYLIFKE